MSGASSDVDAYIAGVAPALRTIARKFDQAVRRAEPSLTEGLYIGIPTWFSQRPVCYLADYSSHVNLGFHQGSRLRDPFGILEGTGKRLRHVKVRSSREAQSAALADLIRQAAQLK